LDQFSKEKQELLNALHSSEIDEQDIQRLIQILNQSDLEKLAKSVQASRETAPPEKELPLSKPKHIEGDSDFDPLKEMEEDLNFVFEDLGSADPEIRTRAAALMAAQPPVTLAESGLKAITSDLPVKIRRLMAGVLKKAGKETVDAFFGKIHVGLPSTSLIKIIRVCDVFADNPGLVPLLRKIALNGPLDVIPSIISTLQPMPGKEVDSVLLDIFERATGKTKWNVIPIFGERKILEATPMLIEFIRPTNIWEKEKEIALQQDVCRTLGVLGTGDATEALIRATQAPVITLFHKAKPDQIRAIATWALTQLPEDPRIDKALAKLKKDRSHLVRKAVELAEIIHT
jgi:hypothetical protein